jgi:hypothetical protein
VTKKDYEKFAEMISYNKAHHMFVGDAKIGYRIALLDVSHMMANIFAADNSRFDKERFLKACGL